ncbi:mannan endo-1,4-beta-mannosidase [Hyalella azteca]|uniref:Mannan endo-1,4-beta-mannosidase n=1 Tax=Hyalella azteca TaxID=294128 RepID=A0A8B7P8S0_HYAAZ|nr:mannan endo-1,4-beta-mannosidase [Hyalella azteca]
MKAFLIIAACLAASASAVKLTVSGSSLMYGGEKVYLSGANAAWNSYGYDFGNGGYDGSLETWLAEVKAAGGNSFRIWVHVEGYSTPNFDSDGYVTACDRTGDFINDVKKFLDAAQANDILVTLTLWNGAVMGNQAYINLVWDDSKLQTYLDNCLAPLASALSGHPALAAYEAINEPEGSVRVESNSNSCYDTTVIGQSGAGWTGVGIPMERFLTFIGKQNIVIKQNDPSALVTLGSWGQFPQSDAFSNTKNHYSDACLNGAAGSGAQLDFYQMHTYDWGSSWSPNAPFTVSASDYKLDRPIVIGEFASVCSLNTPLSDLHNYAYSHGYAGTWTWHWTATGGCSDTRQVQADGLATLADRTDNGLVNIDVR